MPLTSGAKLGPFEIQSALGAGGMGEVYRARDTTLGREVAVKVLPAAFSADPDRLRRFRQEAQAAAALNHPNILAIHHVGQEDGAPYLVTELLEGESLRQRLQSGPLPVRKTIEYSVQVARGLAAAHDKGIVHRDLKPDNIFITRDGRVKILDFGLAKLLQPAENASPDSATMPGSSEPGVVLGTAGYMSPEQVRGQVAGPASDLFAFGAILYEMLSGKRAFRGETAADTMSAVLKEEPPPLTETNRQIPPALERIVRHCLEKNPEERFQSARDLAFDLESLSSLSGTGPATAIAAPAHKTKLTFAAIGVGVIVVAVVAGAVLHPFRKQPAPLPSYRRLTFRQGTIQAARFAPDGQTVVYSASWDGNPPELFTTRPQAPESRSLGVKNGALLALSSSGEIAASLGVRSQWATFSAGTLARMPLEGGAPREILGNIESADWTPDGANLLITRQVGGSDRLEFPPGKLILEKGGAIGHPHISPQGNRIAFFDHPGRGSDNGSVAVMDLAGRETVLSTGWVDLTGLAWAPRGDEIWFTGNRNSGSAGLFAVTLSGKQRTVAGIPGDLFLYDVARDGRVLLGREDWRGGIYALAPGENRERDLSWFDFSIAADLSADGSTLLFYEVGEAGGAQGASYLRKTDGSPAVRLSDGTCFGLSHDGQRVACMTADGQLNGVPTRTGEVKALTHDRLFHGQSQWFRDQKRLVFIGNEPGHGARAYIQDLTTGQARAITPEGASIYTRLSPDETQFAVAMGAEYETWIYPVNGGDPHNVPGLTPGEVPVAWSQDGRNLYCYRLGETPAKVFRVEIATGKRTPWKTFVPPDPVGISFLGSMFLSADAKSYVYSINRRLNVLYLAEGLR